MKLKKDNNKKINLEDIQNYMIDTNKLKNENSIQYKGISGKPEEKFELYINKIIKKILKKIMK